MACQLSIAWVALPETLCVAVADTRNDSHNQKTILFILAESANIGIVLVVCVEVCGN